jgi:ectoine utilization protein EutC
MLIFTEKELREIVQIDEKAISVIEGAFTSLVTRKVVMPPIMRVDVEEHNGEVDVKTAYIEGYDMFAIKVSTGFFNNNKIGLPSGNGMMMLLSTITGFPQAFLLDNGYLTHVRTAAAGAVAANHLAKKNVETVGIIGTGSQSRYQLLALRKVRKFNRVLVSGRDPHKVEQFVKEMSELLDVEAKGDSAENVVKQSDVVITTTPSSTPIIKTEWLHPGLHITAMGSDAEHKQELEAGVLKGAHKLVCDVKDQCFRLGELHHGLEQGTITKGSSIIELGEITSGKAAGRESEEEITVCDLTGTGVQDTAIALYAYERLQDENKGIEIQN